MGLRVYCVDPRGGDKPISPRIYVPTAVMEETAVYTGVFTGHAIFLE